MRWPVAIGLTVGAVVIFLVGLLQTLGYNGTTSLQPVATTDRIWTDFNNIFKGQKGAPYSWDANKSPKIDNKLVTFDKRVIRVLNYLAKQGNSKCIWNGTHEKLNLSIEAEANSDLIKAPYKQISASTLYRGTGLRITSADEVKCTIRPRPGGDPIAQAFQCPISTVFDNKTISLRSYVSVYPDKPYDKVNCQVDCAVDYYPDMPAGATDIVPPQVNSDKLNNLNPSFTGPFDYEQITSKTKDAAIYKEALLTEELLKIDDPGCETADGNTGNERAIPYTMIVQSWIKEKWGDFWTDLTDLADSKVKYTFQEGSPLAGLTFDPNLDKIGLHFNF